MGENTDPPRVPLMVEGVEQLAVSQRGDPIQMLVRFANGSLLVGAYIWMGSVACAAACFSLASDLANDDADPLVFRWPIYVFSAPLRGTTGILRTFFFHCAMPQRDGAVMTSARRANPQPTSWKSNRYAGWNRA
jgi:hypothetical protein